MKNVLFDPRKKYFLLFFLCFIIFGKIHTAAFAEQIILDAESAKYRWFFSDGYIVTAERSFENNQSVVKSLYCSDTLGQRVWSHSLEYPATGMMYCEKTATDLFAVLYRFDGGYYIEFLDHNGMSHHTTAIPNAKKAMLTEDGLIYVISDTQKGGLVFLDWQGNTIKWYLDGYKSINFGSVLSSENRIYLQIFHSNTKNEPSSSIIVLCKDGTVAWDYSLGTNSDCMFTEWTVNRAGGFTMQVQKYQDNSEQLSEIISIDSNGDEQWRYTLDIFPDVFTAQLIDERADGTYVMFGLLKSVEKSAGELIAKVTFDPFVKKINVSNLAEGYGTCTYYRDDLPYILSYTTDLSSVLIYPAE